MQDHLYFFGSNCYVYTSKKDFFPVTARPHAVLLFSADGSLLRLETGRQVFTGAALAVAPRTMRTLSLSGSGLVSVNLPPSSAFFPAFRNLLAPGVHVLERAAFDRFGSFIVGAWCGEGKSSLTETIFRDLVWTAVSQLPAVRPMDPRVPSMLGFLDQNPDASLPDLARAFALSQYRASHLIANSLGLPFKAYRAWQKQVRVCKLLYSNVSLTTIAHEADLTDSAHLSRFYQQWYGQTRSYSRNRNAVRFFS